MKGKSKAKTATDATVAQVARLAGLSIARTYRLRAEGRSDAEIISGSQRRREAIALRNLPSTKVETINGHAANGAVSYAASLAEKERWAAELKRIEVMEKRRLLVPLVYMRMWGVKFLIAAKDELLRGPGELQDALAAESDPRECRRIVERWVTRTLTKFYECERLWTAPPEDDGGGLKPAA
jgi:hypothetical protein